MGPWSWALFLGLTPPFGVKKIMKVWKNENHVKHPMDRPTNHVVSITCFWECASQLWKHVHRTHASIFSQNGPPPLFVVFSSICGTVVKNNHGPGALFSVFLRGWVSGTFGDQGAHFRRAVVLFVCVVLQSGSRARARHILSCSHWWS